MLLIALAAAGAQLRAFDPWAKFSRDGMDSQVVEIASLQGSNAGRLEYRLRFTTRRLRGHNPEVRWADSVTCPAVRTVVLGMDDLAMPIPAPYGGSNETRVIVLDGAEYSLTAPSSYMMGKLTVTSTDGSPLAAWINGAFRAVLAGKSMTMRFGNVISPSFF